MRLAGTVLELGVGVGVAGGIERLLQQVDGVVEEVGVSVADCDMELALELGAECRPVALEDGVDVVMVMPVGDDFGVDLAGERVEGLGRVAVRADGREDGLPDGPLFGTPAVCAEDVLVAKLLLGGGDERAIGLAVATDGDFAEVSLADEGIGVVVEVDVLVGVEVDGIGTGSPGAVVHVGVEDLGGEGFPAAGGSAVGGAGPALGDAAELLFYFRD